MNIIQISKWNGRLGNNVLQLIYSIKYGFENNYNKIIFPKSDYFIKQEVIISKNNYDKKDIISGIYYPFDLEKKPILLFSEMKSIFKKYIEDIIIFKYNYINYNNDDILLHIRSGDIFKYKIPNYVQPPLIFYKLIIDKYNGKKIIISEDTINPCIKNLIKDNNCKRINGNTLEDDINILRNGYNICFGYGTFSIFIMLMNDLLENIYIPDYVYHKMTQSWNIVFDTNKFKINIINLPNYIKVGEWIPNKENIQKMLDYSI
jgi:hypothetical protein